MGEMTTTVENLEFSSSSSESNVHSIPCRVHYNGEARIKEYFRPVSCEERDESQVSFRGYPLIGKRVTLPESYHGFILDNEKSGSLVPIKKFDSLMYWEWDKHPSKNDSFLSALDWLNFSGQVHNPVEEDA